MGGPASHCESAESTSPRTPSATSARGCAIAAAHPRRSPAAQQGLGARIHVHERSYLAMGFPDGAFDVVYSLDALLHAGDRLGEVVAEAARVLRPGGALLFTDHMEAEGADRAAMAPICRRFGLERLATPADYRRWARAAGLQLVAFEDRLPDFVAHRVMSEALLDGMLAWA